MYCRFKKIPLKSKRRRVFEEIQSQSLQFSSDDNFPFYFPFVNLSTFANTDGNRKQEVLAWISTGFTDRLSRRYLVNFQIDYFVQCQRDRKSSLYCAAPETLYPHIGFSPSYISTLLSSVGFIVLFCKINQLSPYMQTHC